MSAVWDTNRNRDSYRHCSATYPNTHPNGTALANTIASYPASKRSPNS